jgi:hypothetical protein
VHVGDRSPSVQQDDDAVLAVQHGIDLLVNTGGRVFESSARCHHQISAVMLCDASARVVDDGPESAIKRRCRRLDRR